MLRRLCENEQLSGINSEYWSTRAGAVEFISYREQQQLHGAEEHNRRREHERKQAHELELASIQNQRRDPAPRNDKNPRNKAKKIQDMKDLQETSSIGQKINGQHRRSPC